MLNSAYLLKYVYFKKQHFYPYHLNITALSFIKNVLLQNPLINILHLTGQFFYGKEEGAKVHDAELVTPKFMLNNAQSCVRFSYYLRGEIDLGLSVYKEEFYR